MRQMEAEYYINPGDDADAIAQYERALARDPGLSGIRYELAEAILADSASETLLERASSLLRETPKDNPKNAGTAAKLGSIATMRNHPDIAEAEYMKALAL